MSHKSNRCFFNYKSATFLFVIIVQSNPQPIVVYVIPCNYINVALQIIMVNCNCWGSQCSAPEIALILSTFSDNTPLYNISHINIYLLLEERGGKEGRKKRDLPNQTKSLSPIPLLEIKDCPVSRYSDLAHKMKSCLY